MTRFHTDLSLGSLNFGELEAVLELAALAARADGTIADSERAAFTELVVARSEGKLDAKLANVVFDKMSGPRGPVEQRLAHVRKHLPDAKKREGALLIAANLVLADDVLHEDERAFLQRAAAALEIDPATLDQLVADARP